MRLAPPRGSESMLPAPLAMPVVVGVLTLAGDRALAVGSATVSSRPSSQAGGQLIVVSAPAYGDTYATLTAAGGAASARPRSSRSYATAYH
ncbi:MAG TPA: hypothetical protein VMF09_15965 [Solirubrobacteraceae bacterium]|nr:hypothetical protein [Solirubrobacteraceae bacterium]